MIVCAHGDVYDYCVGHDMVIVDWHTDSIDNYSGVCPVLVTDAKMSEHEYYFLKGKYLSRGVELVSVQHEDTEQMSQYVMYLAQKDIEERQKFAGRCKFGFKRENGEMVQHEERFKVVERIIELRDAGYTYKRITEDENVRDVDGSRLSLSTVQLIIKNREEYGL